MKLKLKSKHKWCLVTLACVLSVVGMWSFPNIDDTSVAVLLIILSYILFIASAVYCIFGMVEANIFGRFYEWLKTDD